MSLEILSEDEEILVCHKPSGVPVQTAKLGAMDLVSEIRNYLKSPYLGVIHRLDQPVQGILVFGKTHSAAKELNRQLQVSGGFGKYYQAILCGEPGERTGVLEDYLVKDAKTNTSRVCRPTEVGAKRARLFYEVLETFAHAGQIYSLVNIKLDTGRHHQIRVQMANMGCPIWGDTKYGQQKQNQGSWQKIALCAYRLEFEHPKTKKPMQFAVCGLDKCAIFQ